MDNTKISTTKIIYPQIYAYILPNYAKNEGWVKIGYTERQDVNRRVLEQTKTAGVFEEYELLWSAPAKFQSAVDDGRVWFKDHELHHYLRSFKQIQQRPRTEWFYYNGTPELAYQHFREFTSKDFKQAGKQIDYQLRKEQEDAIEQTMGYFSQNPEGEFLWNAKPRFGKTLTSYELARRLEAKKVLIVTNRPAIANSWFDDFEKFVAHQTDYAFVSTSDSLKERPVLTREQFLEQAGQGKRSMIAFVSLQDLKGSLYFGGRFVKLEWVKTTSWDLLIVDEAHEGVDTLKTDIAFDEIKRRFTLHLSGTPFKALASNKFSQDEVFSWTYADEQIAKANWDEDSGQNPYESLPKLNLFSYQICPMIVDEINEGIEIKGGTVDYAFDLNEFFATKEEKFNYEADIKNWLDSLTRNQKYPFSTKELRDELKHTFWLLERVDSAKALKTLLESHPVFENYTIVLAAGDGVEEGGVLNQRSIDRVKKAIKEHDKTITLSVGQLTTGVTIPEWTAVLMLSNLKSPSLYMQAAFRAQNPWQYHADGKMHQKKNAYVFDFAPERTLSIYEEFANDLSATTSGGGGTSEDREKNVRQLLNFFPVIAEDDGGKMVELDATQVLTLPKIFKAREVVRCGFMCNFLFQNVSRLFASEEAQKILAEVKKSDIKSSSSPKPLDDQGVRVDEAGEAVLDLDIVISETKANFGQRFYGSVQEVTNAVTHSIDTDTLGKMDDLSDKIAQAVEQNLKTAADELAKNNGVTQTVADKAVKQATQVIAREIQLIQQKSAIEHAEAEQEYKKALAEPWRSEEADEAYKRQCEQIAENLKQKITQTVDAKLPELAGQTTESILQKAKDNEKAVVDENRRERLRDFARTIPSFLMAYGDANTTLANFDSIVETDEVFKEVTGITLDQFRLLRDELNLFDETVFNQSVQEFLDKRQKLANYFDDSQTEDIFDYIPPQKTNQIYTPKRVVKMMIDKMEEEDPQIFERSDVRFADLYVKSGLYLAEIVKRLYKGLEQKIPNPQERLKHILEKQVYGFAPSTIIWRIAQRFVFGFDERGNAVSKTHLVCLDTTPIAMGANAKEEFQNAVFEKIGKQDVRFDVVVGNPPYQDDIEHREEQPAIYHYFYNLAGDISQRYCLISPARFLFKVGSTPSVWNEKMLNDEHLKVLLFEQNSAKLFPPPIDIKGGLAVVYRNCEEKFGAIKHFTSYEELRSITKKVVVGDFVSIGELLYGNTSYKYSDVLWQENESLIQRVSGGSRRYLSSSVFDRLPEIFYESKPQDGKDYIQILGRQDNKRILRWMRRDYLAVHPNMDKYKVMVPSSNGTGAIGEVLSTPLIGQPLIGQPLIGHTETFISFGAFDEPLEADNLLKYIKTRFARTMLGVVKVTQGNKTKEVWSKVPLQDFTANSDIDWTQSVADIDRQLYQKYGLDQVEIDFIEEKVRAMV